MIASVLGMPRTVKLGAKYWSKSGRLIARKVTSICSHLVLKSKAYRDGTQSVGTQSADVQAPTEVN